MPVYKAEENSIATRKKGSCKRGLTYQRFYQLVIGRSTLHSDDVGTVGIKIFAGKCSRKSRNATSQRESFSPRTKFELPRRNLLRLSIITWNICCAAYFSVPNIFGLSPEDRKDRINVECIIETLAKIWGSYISLIPRDFSYECD